MTTLATICDDVKCGTCLNCQYAAAEARVKKLEAMLQQERQDRQTLTRTWMDERLAAIAAREDREALARRVVEACANRCEEVAREYETVPAITAMERLLVSGALAVRAVELRSLDLAPILGHTESEPRCQNCGKPATCIGAYEGMNEEEYACDDCCGHGCEDGRCERVKGAPSPTLPPLIESEPRTVAVPVEVLREVRTELERREKSLLSRLGRGVSMEDLRACRAALAKLPQVP